MNKLIKTIEELLLEEYKTVPFHNIFMLNGIEKTGTSFGGTCSDKVLHFQKVLQKNSITSTLQSAYINGNDCHRLLAVMIQDQKFYIDVGSGFPSCKIFPAFKSIEYSVYGMSFRTEIRQNSLVIYHKTKAVHNEMSIIPFQQKTQNEILKDIKKRYFDTSVYPFRNSLRFSILIEDTFHFIKKKQLKLFNSHKNSSCLISKKAAYSLINNVFNFDMQGLDFVM